MRHEKKLTALTASILASVIAWSAVNCFLTAFGLSAERGTAVFLVCVASAVLSALLFSFRYGGIAVLCLLALGAGYICRDGNGAQQLRQLLHFLTSIYNRPYGWGIFPLEEGLSPERIFDIPLGIWCVIMAVTVSCSICRRKPVVLPVLTILLPLCTCIVVTDTVPDARRLFPLLAGLILLILTASVRQEDGFQGLWLTAIAAPAVIAALAALFLTIPQEGYVNRSAILRENIIITARNIPQFLDNGMTQLASKVQPKPPKQVDLSALGSRIPYTYPVMTVTAEKTGTLYLRGQDYDLYDGLHWTASEDRSETFSRTGSTSQRITVITEDRKGFRYLPYYPAEDTVLTGGLAANPGKSGEYSVSQCMLPEDWRQTAYQSTGSPDQMQQYLSLPEATRQAASEFLEQKYSAAVSNTAKADIIAALVTDCAKYDLDSPRMPASEPDFALWFLREGEQGYCVHFATAATVLLRSAGIPARYVTGYMLEAVAGEAVTVTEENAHAWAEYYEPNLDAWIPLEATPSAISPPEIPSNQSVPTEPVLSAEPKPTVAETLPEPTPANTEPQITFPVPEVPVPQQTHRVFPTWILAVPLILLILAGQRILRLNLRRRRQRTGAPNVQALHRWRETLRLSRILKETPPETLMQLAQKAKFSQYELTRDELEQFDTFHRSALRRLREKPWYSRLICQYIYAAY